jgi:transcriptional regulator with PAS, ATPase and Fis domain
MNFDKEQDYIFNMFDAVFSNADDLVDEYSSTDTDLKYSLVSELEKLERERVVNALAFANGNQTNAANALNIGRTNLIAKMKKYRI